MTGLLAFNTTTSITVVVLAISIALTGYVLFNLRQSGKKQTYMGYVLIMMQVSQFCNFVFCIFSLCYVNFENSKNITTFLRISTLPAFGYSLWSLAAWFLTFKYWSTAFELRYLFRMESDERKKQHNRLYCGLNTIPIIMIIAFFVYTIISLWIFDTELAIRSNFITYAVAIFTMCVQIDAMRRMQ